MRRSTVHVGCGCVSPFVIMLINLIIGTISVVYILSWFDKTIPLIGSIVIGLIGGEFTIPIAIIGWILRLFGVF